ncbi:hypothetical protein [Nocardia sp. CY41]|uniref:hypothetical protein n=1 Tax=Nocardia sp. CY41 TaxID=2608686 RepID=UPI001359CE9B|nr:hypothetical protein [Nocardia sp. CY41]
MASESAADAHRRPTGSAEDSGREVAAGQVGGGKQGKGNAVRRIMHEAYAPLVGVEVSEVGQSCGDCGGRGQQADQHESARPVALPGDAQRRRAGPGADRQGAR